MPFCPQCKTEYLQGIRVCPDCNVELVDMLPEDDVDFSEDVETVLLCQLNEMMIAQMLGEALREAGIPYLVKSSMGTYSGYLSVNQAMKGVKIYVSQGAFEDALRIAETIIPDFKRPDEETKR